VVSIRCKGVTFQNIEAVLFDKDGTLANSEAFLRSLAQKRSRMIDAQFPGVQEPLLMAFGVDGERLDPAGLMAVGKMRLRRRLMWRRRGALGWKLWRRCDRRLRMRISIWSVKLTIRL
jgi:phosphoglycolate phosphatase-like HAD superfamily hydrolase